jgi:hypothetical protein
VALAACGGGSGTNRSSQAPSTTVVDQAGSAGALVPQLLTVTDLPAGWSAETTGPASDLGLPACFRSTPSSGAPNEVEARFRQGSGLPTLQEVLAGYGNVAAATAGFRSLDARLGSCGELQFAAAGYTFTGRVEPVTGPPVGDQHRAYQAALATAGTGAATTTTFDFLLARKGATVLVLVYAAVGVPPAATLDGLAARAAAKVP